MRKLFLIGLIVVSISWAALLYHQGEVKDPREITGQFNFTIFDVLGRHEDIELMTTQLFEETKNLIGSTRYVPVNQLVLPKPKDQTFSGQIDWEQKDFAPLYVQFFFEEVDGKAGEKLKIFQTFRCSPSFIFAIDNTVALIGGQTSEQRYQRLRHDQKAIDQANRDVIYLQSILDLFSSNEDQYFSFDNQAYKDLNLAFSRNEARVLRSAVGPAVFFLIYGERLLVNDPKGLGVEPDVSVKSLAFINAQERLKIRDKLLSEVRMRHTNIQLSWPAAYSYYYLRHHRFRAMWLNFWQRRATMIFGLLLVFSAYCFWQLFVRSLDQLIFETAAIASNQSSVTPGAINDLRRRFYRRYPLSWLCQPRQRVVKTRLLGVWADYQREQDSKAIREHASALWQQIKQTLGYEPPAFLAEYLSAKDPNQNIRIRRKAIVSLEAFWGELIRTTMQAVAGSAAKKFEASLVVPRREALLDQVRGLFPPQALKILSEDKLGLLRELNRSEQRSLLKILLSVGVEHPQLVAALVKQTDWKPFLAPDSGLMKAIIHKDFEQASLLLGLRAPEIAERTEVKEGGDFSGLLARQRVTLISANQSNKEKLVGIVLSFGAVNCDFIDASNLSRIRDAAQSGGSSERLFIVLASSSHKVSDVLAEAGARFIWVNTYNPGRFAEELREALKVKA